MGNTLSCCVCLNANRRVGPAPDSESEVYEAAAGDPVVVAPAPAAVEPTELDFRAGEGHHLQHISDREMPEGAAQLTVTKCAIMTLVYVEKLLIYAEIDLCPTNWKRIVLGAILLASKVWDHKAVSDYCQILKDITVEDMNEMGRHFVELLEFDINVPSSIYARYYFDLCSFTDDDNLSFPIAPLSTERAQSLEAISRLCEDKYKDLGRVAVRRSFSADHFIGIQRSNAIL